MTTILAPVNRRHLGLFAWVLICSSFRTSHIGPLNVFVFYIVIIFSANEIFEGFVVYFSGANLKPQTASKMASVYCDHNSHSSETRNPGEISHFPVYLWRENISLFFGIIRRRPMSLQGQVCPNIDYVLSRIGTLLSRVKVLSLLLN